MIKIYDHIIEPTIFPDKTSQVWKLPEKIISRCAKASSVEVLWEFEKESELIHLAQLACLIRQHNYHITLNVPYFPYARQDKKVENESTFSFRTFSNLLNSIEFRSVISIDIHNELIAEESLNNFRNISAIDYIKDTLSTLGNCSNICFPDAGSLKRYSKILDSRLFKLKHVTFTKARNQLTGAIEKLYIDDLNSSLRFKDINDKDFLIVDDICDGGGTFELTAKELYRYGAKNVYLYVTHGLFTKGFNGLRDSGIKRIFTYKGEVTNYV